ncbi:MAG: HD domain-containing protein [Eubacteriales bacterium]
MGSVLEILKSDELKIIRVQIDSFCEEIMKEYLEECQGLCQRHSLSSINTKNFYDSVWGTIEINEGEILILDSPILQRLRHIKQLGLANLLYASADHSRFSHTLGVVQTAEIMQKQIEKELDKKGVNSGKDVNQIIRLAAIFHDCGHMFCSHASERFFLKNTKFSLYKDVEKIQRYINSRISIKPSLSEIISAFIIQSPSVIQLLKVVEKGLAEVDLQAENIDCIIEKICCFIWGYPYSEKLLPYAQIISGQIDADKLDYLKRDSHSTGVPAAVDMSRVFQKLRVVQSNMDFKMKSTAEEDVETRYTIAIAPAAINTIDQLIISRYMMFENVYFHQKTLTAETSLRYALELLCMSTKKLFDNFRNILMLQDNDVVSVDFDPTIKNAVPEFEVVNQEIYDHACQILSNLAKRKLFKRSVAFTCENLIDVGYKGLEFYSKIFKDKSLESQDKFIKSVESKVEQCKLQLINTNFYTHKKTDVLLIVSPDVSNININSNLAIAEKNNKNRDMEFEADSWLKSRSSRKPQNYLVTYGEDRYIVYIAVEYILLVEYGLLIADSIIYDEKDRIYIDKIKNELERKGFYSKAFAIAPNREIDIYNREIERLVNKNWKFYELISADNGFSSNMDIAYLTTYIKQFYQFKDGIGQYSSFVKGCIEMLNDVKVISKQEIFKALKSNFDEISKKENISFERLKICNIGNVQDGSAQIAYQVNSINEAFKAKNSVISLQEALRFSQDGQVIVFVEDAFCSGRQIISIFETYMGVNIGERQTQEEHVKELSDDDKKNLKNSKLYFSFIMYNKENEKFFKEKLKKIGITKVEIIANKEFPSKYFERNTLDENSQILKKYFEKVGRLLIEKKATNDKGDRKTNWSDQRIANSVLGYNDAQQTIVFAWNTPTYTLTPLWMQGEIDGVEWIPLFPRIDK